MGRSKPYTVDKYYQLANNVSQALNACELCGDLIDQIAKPRQRQAIERDIRVGIHKCSRRKQWVWGTMGLIAIVIGGCKKTASWDAINKGTISSLSTEAETLAKSNKPDDAMAKYQQLFAVVGDHKVSDADLQQTIATAQVAMQKVKHDAIIWKIRLLADQQLAIAAMKRASVVMRANLPDKTGQDALQTQQMISDNDRDLPQAIAEFQTTWQKLKPLLDSDSATVMAVAQEIIHDPTTTDEQAEMIKGMFRLQ